MNKKVISIVLALLVLSLVNIISGVNLEIGIIAIIFGTLTTATIISWGFDV